MKLNLRSIVDSAKSAINKSAWTIQKNSPKILFVMAAIGTVTGTVMACKATPKAIEHYNKYKADMEICKKNHEEKVTATGEEYTDKDYKSDVLTLRTHLVINETKTYGPAALVVGTSVFGFAWSNFILEKRLETVMAAYTVAVTKLNDIKNRIADKYGEEAVDDIYNGKSTIEMEEFDENGNKKTAIYFADDDNFTATFASRNSDGSMNTRWVNDNEANLFLLERIQRDWTNILKARNGKPVYENEIRRELGMNFTQKGQACGWRYSTDPNHKGDNCINFHIDKYRRILETEGADALDNVPLVINFNCDGDVIWAQ